MDLKRLEIKKNIQKAEDKNLSFRVFELNSNTIQEYLQPHKKDHFCILIIETGKIQLHIEEKIHFLKEGKISIIFPDQVNFLSNPSTDLSGKIVLFEEVLFCSDILKNELSSYNVNLSENLNCLLLAQNEFDHGIHTISEIQTIYNNPTLIKKEQARFFIKVFLLGLIESVHGQHPVFNPETESDKQVYFQFKKLLNQHFKTQRTVQYYAGKLVVTPKKLNILTKKYCGETAINAVHNRILTEIKRQLLFSDLSHKEIAFDLGFSSPSALNKFVRAKLKETPTELQNELAQIYTA
ncbi:helix-turn-helix transcriptional regulator [Flavobacterium sp. MC2016-06]|jgi:AraC family transcriptional activator of pobA|uniref:AraC family transcriptional regulator n=1 Tax=Flavobacterium sp. MC2016-06 TaxID=2676308 RepID=UPI0012BAE5B7|nr:helix-turn-helix transcriptional regulator [Flavobacterium sp. MC2016-06]MBU3862435.1 AraC family transcriptional regulator [Flavobacterium sp. MC2016-06]